MAPACGQFARGTDEATKAAARTQAEGQIKAVQSPWFRHFLVYDPNLRWRLSARYWRSMASGNLASRSPPEAAPPIEAALKEAGNTDVTIRELPGLNHLFQTSDGSIGERQDRRNVCSHASETIGDRILDAPHQGREMIEALGVGPRLGDRESLSSETFPFGGIIDAHPDPGTRMANRNKSGMISCRELVGC